MIEIPFTILRKATVSLTSEDAYSKPWLVISVAVVPLWISFYLERDGIDLWSLKLGSMPLMAMLLPLSVGAVCLKI